MSKIDSIADYEIADGVSIQTRVVVTGKAMRSYVPYELFRRDVLLNTGTGRRQLQAFFTEEEVDMMSGLRDKADRWMQEGPSKVVLTIEEFKSWRRISEFIATVVCVRKWNVRSIRITEN